MQTTVERCSDASLDGVTWAEEFPRLEDTNSDVTRSGRIFGLEIPTLLA